MLGSVTQSTGDATVSIRAGIDSDAQETLTESAIYDILSNDRRRHALAYLFENSEEDWPTLRELSRAVAAREADIDPEAVTAEDRRRVHIAFHQTHLPKLEEAGLIDYDTESKRVALTDRASTVRPYLLGSPRTDRSSEATYVSVAGLGFAVAAASTVLGLPTGLGAALVSLTVLTVALTDAMT